MKCKSCDGTGMIELVDSVDYGSTCANLESLEFCEDCLLSDICPNCGESQTIPWDYEADEPGRACSNCGWEWKGYDGEYPQR